MKKFFLLFVLAANIFYFSNFTFAQSDSDFEDVEENIFLPEAPETTDTFGDEEENIYLREDKPVEKTTTKTPAQTANGKLSGVYEGTELACPYYFERDLELGSVGEDVKLLQIILNKKVDTMIALDGPGSPTLETNSFGEATKAAVKRFQNMYIEYIGLANGRFGPRTRTVMNQICSGKVPGKTEEAYGNVVSVQANATPQGEITVIPNDKIAPLVTLTANITEVEISSTFKVVVDFSEEVKPITPDSVIIDGGMVKEIRKLSKTSNAITIVPNPDTKNILVQIEADKVEDLAGNLNENASNEINVKIKTGEIVTDENNTDTNQKPKCTYDAAGNLIVKDEETGEDINTEGCSEKNNDKEVDPNEAKYNAKLGCYANTGNLPEGIQETQRCGHPENPNNPSSPCSALNQSRYKQELLNYHRQKERDSYFGYGFGYGYEPINPCSNQSIAAKTQNEAARQQQKEQGQGGGGGGGGGLGDLLGKIMQGMGGGGDGAGGGVGDGGGGSAPDGTTPAADPATSQYPDPGVTANQNAGSGSTKAEFIPKEGTVQGTIFNEQCKFIETKEGKIVKNDKSLIYTMKAINSKIYTLLYPKTTTPGRQQDRLTYCSIYKEGSVKKLEFIPSKCCSQPNNNKCTGKIYKLVEDGYETNITQIFSLGECKVNMPLPERKLDNLIPAPIDGNVMGN